MQDSLPNTIKPLQVSSSQQENYHFIVNPEFIKRSSRTFIFSVIGLIGLYILFFNQELIDFSWTSCNKLILLAAVMFLLYKTYQFYLRAQQVIINKQGIYLQGLFFRASGRFIVWDKIDLIGIERDRYSYFRLNYAGHVLSFVYNKKQFYLDDERERIAYYKNLETDLSLQEAVEKFIGPITELTTEQFGALWGDLKHKEKISRYFYFGATGVGVLLFFFLPSNDYPSLNSYRYNPLNWWLAVVMYTGTAQYLRGHPLCYTRSFTMGFMGFIVIVQAMSIAPILLGHPEKNTFTIVEETLNYQLWRSTTDKELYFKLSCKVAKRKYAGISTNTSLPLYRLVFIASVKREDMERELCDHLK